MNAIAAPWWGPDSWPEASPSRAYTARQGHARTALDELLTMSTPSPLELQRSRRIAGFLSALEAAERWDGGVAPRMTAQFARMVFRFAVLVPTDVPVPECYYTPEGSICFDWDEDPQNQLSVMLQKSNRIAYAAYRAGERVHGSADFAASLPDELVLAIRKWKQRACTKR